VPDLEHSFLGCYYFDITESFCLFLTKAHFKLNGYKILKQSVHIPKYYGGGHLVSEKLSCLEIFVLLIPDHKIHIASFVTQTLAGCLVNEAVGVGTHCRAGF
jgi:hypothetical protein